MSILVSRNPVTGEVLKEIPCTAKDSLPEILARAKDAQSRLAALSTKRRASYLFNSRETLLHASNSVASLVSQENGKPYFEALANEIFPAVETLTFFGKRSPKLLADQNIPLSLMKHRQSRLNYWPLGVVGIISPWNYPFLLPFAQSCMALAAGNAVLFKPSEATPLVGLKIRELIENSGFPKDLFQILIGAGDLGAALVEQKLAKIFFTGSVTTGKKIMAAAANHLTPIKLELGGKDPMIVLQDADLDFATSAALWGGFTNSGQVCASTERINRAHHPAREHL